MVHIKIVGILVTFGTCLVHGATEIRAIEFIMTRFYSVNLVPSLGYTRIMDANKTAKLVEITKRITALQKELSKACDDFDAKHPDQSAELHDAVHMIEEGVLELGLALSYINCPDKEGDDEE